MRFVALDIGARKTTFVVMSPEKEVIERGAVRALTSLKKLLGPNTPRARVAFEACREGWFIAKMLKEAGHEPVMIDTTRVRRLGIGEHGRKNDEIDVETLALALVEDRIPKAHILSEHRQRLRTEQGIRRHLIEARAHATAMVRSLCRSRGEPIEGGAPYTFARSFAGRVLTEETRELVQPLVDTISALNVQIIAVEKKIEQLAEKEPVVEQLCTAPGVGVNVSAAFVSVIDDAKRFKRAHEVESYLGLVPTEKTTGGRQRLGGISKAGNHYLRTLLNQSAWAVLRAKNDKDPLTIWGRAIAQKRGFRIAVTAVSRRLAGILWAMWRDGTMYDARVLANASQPGLRAQIQTTEEQLAALAQARKKNAQQRYNWSSMMAE